MKAICEYTEEELINQRAVRDEIFEKIKYIPHDEKWDIDERIIGYAHYTFKVKPSQRMLNAIGRNPTTNEMIMIVDGGFSHFGATCNEFNGVYSGRVNTD